MNVKRVSVTRSYVDDKEMTAEELIIYIARVSNPSNQLNTDTAPKLLRWLMSQPHWSPFEMADMTVEIITSRAIAQQILRHRSFSFQEFSQRYAEVTDFEPIQLRKQAVKNRQSSTDAFEDDINRVKYVNDWTQEDHTGSAASLIESHITSSNNLYKALIAEGVAKECARFVLPATTQTRLYMKGSVRSWIHYFQVRCDPHTQLEHRQIAQKIRELFNFSFPNTSEALYGNDTQQAN